MCIRDSVQVDLKVGVHQTMAHADNIIPRNFGYLFLRGGRNPISGFTDDLNILDERQDQFPIAIQVFARHALSKADGLALIPI